MIRKATLDDLDKLAAMGKEFLDFGLWRVFHLVEDFFGSGFLEIAAGSGVSFAPAVRVLAPVVPGKIVAVGTLTSTSTTDGRRITRHAVSQVSVGWR